MFTGCSCWRARAPNDHATSQNELVVDERRGSIERSPDLAEAALAVEVARAAAALICIESDRVARPSICSDDRVLEAAATNAAPLDLRMHCHVRQVDRSFHVREIRDIDGPWLLRRQTEGSHDDGTLARHPYLRVSQIGDRTRLGRLRGPRSRAESTRQLVRRCRSQRGESRRVRRPGKGERQLHR